MKKSGLLICAVLFALFGCSSSSQSVSKVVLVNGSGLVIQNSASWYEELSPGKYRMQGRVESSEYSNNVYGLTCAEKVGEAFVYHGFEVRDPRRLLLKYNVEDPQVFDVVLEKKNGYMQLDKLTRAAQQNELLSRYEDISFMEGYVAGSVPTEIQKDGGWVTFVKKGDTCQAVLKKLNAKQRDSASIGYFGNDNSGKHVADITLIGNFMGIPMINNLSIVSYAYESKLYDYVDGESSLSIVAKDGNFIPMK